MNLCFTGRGSMLYLEEGNTAAYLEDEKNFYLIDCGEDVAQKLIENNKIKKEKEYYLFVTHTHSDHFGSVGTLASYLYYCCGKVLNIVYDENVDYLEEIKTILKNQYIYDYNYKLIKTTDIKPNKLFKNIKYVKTDHGDPLIKSCGLIIEGPNGKILYTGDIKDEKVIIDFINENQDIDKIYVDTSKTEMPVHLNLEKLKEIIPEDRKDKIYCMHINDITMLKEIKKEGFHFVTKINNINKEDIIEILRNYNLNKEEFCIISSASLVLQDAKNTTRDIDISVSDKLFNELLENYNCLYEKTNPDGSSVYMIDDVINFSNNYYQSVDTTKLDGYNVQTLESVKQLKKELNRKKDQYDLFLIDQKLKEQK